jgi:GTP-binding protein HflX
MAMKENRLEPEKFLLVSIIPQATSDDEAFKDLKELKSLVEARGGKVVDIVIQRREIHDKGMYIGQGKIFEIADIIKEKKVDVVILNAVVKPGHIFEITTMLSKTKRTIKVWDRIDLILEIFSKHANTAEARLQIELAAMRHMGPRIYGMGEVMSRQTGGIGGRGVGETNTELMKRHWQKEMKKTKDKLNKLATDKERQLEHRKEIGFQTVSIIGYTNAGKSSLFNKLTGKKTEVQNALFVTLDSSTGKVIMPNSKTPILLSDTIGFIKNLPPDLIDAFKSTLMESIYADLLLHVIDITDDDIHRKIAAVEDILLSLGLRDKKRIYIFNKTDAMDGISKNAIEEQYHDFYPQFISVKENSGVEDVLKAIEESLTNGIPHLLKKRKIVHVD